MWRSRLRMKSRLMPRRSARALMQVNAACADSCMTSPSLPVSVTAPRPFTTYFGPGKASRQSNLTFSGDTLLPELDWAQHLAYAIGPDRVFETVSHTFGDKLSRKLATTRTDLAFEVADPGLAGEVADDLQNAFVTELKLLRSQSVGFGLFRHQVAFGDLELFAFRVTGKPQHFQPVL